MKELNRREFLTLSGAAVVALSLAGCGGPSNQLRESEMIQEIRNKYGNGSYRGTAGVSNSTHDGMQLKQLYPRSPSEVREFVRYLAGHGLASPHPEQWMIGLYCPTIKGKTYTVAVMVNFAPI